MIAIDSFLDSGATSELHAPDEPLAIEDILPGGEVHEAVVALQKCYPSGKLPAPHARNPWRLLLRLARSADEPFNLQNDMHEVADILRNWAESELAKSSHGARPTSVITPNSCLSQFAAAYAACGYDAINLVAVRLGEDRSVGPDLVALIRRVAGPSFVFLGTVLVNRDGDRAAIGLFLHWHAVTRHIETFKDRASESGAMTLANGLLPHTSTHRFGGFGDRIVGNCGLRDACGLKLGKKHWGRRVNVSRVCSVRRNTAPADTGH